MKDENHPAPRMHTEFIERFPELGRAWELMTQAGDKGPLDAKTARLIKLAVAVGTGGEGAVHASVRKGIALGITAAEVDQVVALAASTVGLPAAVAAWSWSRDLYEERG